MAPRVLLRAGKSPFEKIDPASIYWNDLIAGNTGNIIFAYSAYKSLSAPGVTIDVTGYKNPSPEEADAINERYDLFVLPLANAFRPSFIPQIEALTRLIRKLKIPVVIVGIGAQAKIDDPANISRTFSKAVQDFIGAVLDRSSAIGVRGEFTAEYLQALGFKDIDVIGCPSMFMYGSQMNVRKKTERLDRDSRIAWNLTPGVSDEIVPLVQSIVSGYPNSTFVGQTKAELALLLWNKSRSSQTPKDLLPETPDHPLVRSSRACIFTEFSSWRAFQNNQDFAIGTRIHGNVSALLSGTPGFVIAHDSRTLELARYFQIPHRSIHEFNQNTNLIDIYSEADYSSLNNGHSARFDKYRQFFKKNGLPFVFDHEGADQAYDQQLSRSGVSGEIYPLDSMDKAEISTRAVQLAESAISAHSILEGELSSARKEIEKLKKNKNNGNFQAKGNMENTDVKSTKKKSIFSRIFK